MVHLPQLIKLEVVEDFDEVGNLFDHLVTPVLNDLRIKFTVQWAQSPFISCLCRTACALHRFEISDILMTDLELVEILHMLSSPAELIIDYPHH